MLVNKQITAKWEEKREMRPKGKRLKKTLKNKA